MPQDRLPGKTEMSKRASTARPALSRSASAEPSGSEALSRGADSPQPPGDPAHGDTTLDRYDISILQTLQSQARISNIDLANHIGLSAAPTWRRVRRLEQLGYIVGYRAELNRRLIGLGVLAFVRVDADRHNAQATAELERTLRQLPEVIACHYISGAGTFELQVVATDLDAYSRWTMSTLFKLPHVKDVHTSFSLGEVKAGAALPLTHLQPLAGQAKAPPARRA